MAIRLLAVSILRVEFPSTSLAINAIAPLLSGEQFLTLKDLNSVANAAIHSAFLAQWGDICTPKRKRPCAQGDICLVEFDSIHIVKSEARTSCS